MLMHLLSLFDTVSLVLSVSEQPCSSSKSLRNSLRGNEIMINLKRFICSLLIVSLISSLVPAHALAEEIDAGDTRHPSSAFSGESLVTAFESDVAIVPQDETDAAVPEEPDASAPAAPVLSSLSGRVIAQDGSGAADVMVQLRCTMTALCCPPILPTAAVPGPPPRGTSLQDIPMSSVIARTAVPSVKTISRSPPRRGAPFSPTSPSPCLPPTAPPPGRTPPPAGAPPGAPCSPPMAWSAILRITPTTSPTRVPSLQSTAAATLPSSCLRSWTGTR